MRRMGWWGLAALALAGCGDQGGSGRLLVQLHDAPGDVRAAVVTISRVYLAGEAADSTQARVVLRDTPFTTDLTKLRNVADTLLQAQVPAGTYGQLRFVITGGYLEVEGANGTSQIYATPGYSLSAGKTASGSLHCPSCGQSGLKVVLTGALKVEEGKTTVVDVDFDVSDSFGQAAGASGQWVMRPTLKGTVTVK